jgi:carbonic anhydrase
MLFLSSLCFASVLLSSQQSALVTAQDWQDSYNLDFSYDPSAENGPDAWGNAQGTGPWVEHNNRFVEQFGNQCAAGGRPSPLHLEELSQQCNDIHELLPRQMSEVDCTREDMTFDITPYSLRASFPLSDDTCSRPTLTASGRFDDYALLWMELHARSEHVIEGKRYDAELQMIHGGLGVEEGGIMAVSLLIEATASADNLEFEWMLQQWEQVAEQEALDCSRRNRQLRKVSDYELKSEPKEEAPSLEKTQRRELQFRPSPCDTDRFGAGCEPLAPRRRMYPYNLWPSIWYYGYSGSLTTPPCTNGVQWRVLEQPLQISRRQHKQLTQVLTRSRDSSCELDTKVNPTTGENFRPLQPRNQFFQNVFRCTFDDFGHFVYEPDEQ